MAAHVRTVVIPEDDRGELRRRVRSKGAPARVVERARIVLLAGEGSRAKQIAALCVAAEPTVVTWRGRYAESGLAGLADLPRPGSASPLPEALRDRVLELTFDPATHPVRGDARVHAATGHRASREGDADLARHHRPDLAPLRGSGSFRTPARAGRDHSGGRGGHRLDCSFRVRDPGSVPDLDPDALWAGPIRPRSTSGF